MIESPFIVKWRKTFLQRISQYRAEGRPIFYLDESFINSNHSPSKVLTDTTVKSAADAAARGLSTGIPRPAGKGPRVIIIGCGSSDGWVPGSAVIWKRCAEQGVITADYHSDINAENFKPWLENDVLPKLPENAVIVSLLIDIISGILILCCPLYPC